MKKLSEILTLGLEALLDCDPDLSDALAHLYWTGILSKPEYVGARNYLLAWRYRERLDGRAMLMDPNHRRELYFVLVWDLARRGH